MTSLRILLAAAATVCSVLATDVNPAFGVATVKVSDPDITTRHFTIEGRRFLTFQTSLADLIQFAWNLHPRQIISGPGWLESSRFDVVGLASGDRQPTEPEWTKMMANLVAERFHLRYHLEKRELPVYAITADQGGPNLEPSHSDPNALPSLGFRGRGELVARNASLADLAWELQSAVLDRPVVDQSGLSKRFDFRLSWTPDEFQTPALAADAGNAETAPNLFTAIRQQLGLRVTSTRSSVDVMVIEHIALPDPD